MPRARRVVATVLVGLLLMLAVTATGLALMRSAVRERSVQRIRAETAWLAAVVPSLDRPQAQAFARSAARELRLRVTFLAADGTVLADSAVDGANVANMENHIDRPEIIAARFRGQGNSRRTSSTTTVEYLYAAHLVEGDQQVKYVRVALPTSELDRVGSRQVATLLLAVVSAAALLALGALVLSRRLRAPQARMTRAAERIAAGDFATDIGGSPGAGSDRLVIAMRKMQRALTDKIGELDAERTGLLSVIATMREGLLLIDTDRRVRLANDAVRRIFDLDFNPEGYLLAEVVRHPTVLEEVEGVLADGREVREALAKFSGPDRVFQLYVTPLAGPAPERPAEVLVLLFDTTRLEALERVRREFVANVSHELRTPLTAIKAALETLAGSALEDPVTARQFLSILSRQTDRMGALIDDLTDLSLIETGAISLDKELLDASLVARDVVEQLRPLARSHEVELQTDLEQTVHLFADRCRLEQMLTNLIENALKFNRKGGYVMVRASTEDAQPCLAVEDNGIGLAVDVREKVFNRFFQVDPARSRALRGTGLGLAIVKHLMRLHDGSVDLESELGQGSRFSLRFPPGDQAKISRS